MKYTRIIAKNIDRGTAKSRLARVITITSTAVCMVVICIALSIESGFRSTINSRSEALMGNLSVVERQLWGGGYYFEKDSSIIPLIEQTSGVERAFEVLETPAVARFEGVNQGVVINGVNGTQFGNTLSEITVSGSTMIDTQNPTVIISQALASAMGAVIGEQIEFLVFTDGIPTRMELSVGGIFSTSIGEVEMPIVFAPIEVARELASAEESDISSYRITGHPNIEILDEVIREEGYEIAPANPNAAALTDWLSMLQGNVWLVLIIMIAVALINIVSCSLIVVLENTPRIGVLRSLGMRSRTLEKIFVSKIVYMVVWGGAIGWSIGWLIILTQKQLSIITLDSRAYFVETLPMNFTPASMFEVFLLSLLIVTIAVWTVVRIVSRTDIAKSIKYE